MSEKDIAEIKHLLSTSKKVVIIPHKNPDGDAIGASLALYQFLKRQGHEVTVIAPNDYPHFLKWMPFEKDVLKFDSNQKNAEKRIEEAAVIFTLDFNSLSRVGDMQVALSNAKGTFIMIDHHQQPDDYATYMYSDTSIGSTCEMLFNFLQWLDGDALIDAETASCLYAGIMTDTGSFRFPSTSSTTHKVIALLIDKGIDNAAIHNSVYDTNSLDKLQLLGCALKNLVYLAEYHTAYIALSKEELSTFNFKKGDTEGFVNYGLSIEGAKLAAIFIESLEEDHVKISLRSKGDLSVNQMAREHFEGGGHINAAGGRSDKDLKGTIAYFKSILPSYKDKLVTS